MYAVYLILSLADKDAPTINAFHVEGPQENKTVRKEELTIVDDDRQ